MLLYQKPEIRSSKPEPLIPCLQYLVSCEEPNDCGSATIGATCTTQQSGATLDVVFFLEGASGSPGLDCNVEATGQDLGNCNIITDPAIADCDEGAVYQVICDIDACVNLQSVSINCSGYENQGPCDLDINL